MALTDNEMTLIVLGAGALISLGSARFQHWRDRVSAKDDRAEAQQQALTDERRGRECDAAKELLKKQAEIRSVLRNNNVEIRPQALESLTEEVDILSAYIDDDALRERVEYLGGIIWWCEDIGGRVGKDPRDVAWESTNELGWIAGCLLRGKTHPEPDWYPSWRAAWDAAERDNIKDQEAALAAAAEQRRIESSPDNYR